MVKNIVKEPFVAIRVRIERHTDWYDFPSSTVCLRAEVYGCEFQSGEIIVLIFNRSSVQ